MLNNYNNYKHFVSLGANCFVAEDLKLLGLRDCSYPFDWLFADDFSGIISAIESDFSDFLSYDYLLQHEDNRTRYFNSAYRFSFYHDFNKYESLKSQLPSVQVKYNRRISRFKNDICEPTVFFRYIISKNDMNFVTNNYEKIDALLKGFCPLNRIIYISHYEELSKLPVEIYIAKKDDGDWITRTPLSKNDNLKKVLMNTFFENKESNKAFSQKAHHQFSFERFFRRLLHKEYRHSKTYKLQK